MLSGDAPPVVSAVIVNGTGGVTAVSERIQRGVVVDAATGEQSFVIFQVVCGSRPCRT